MSTVELRHVTKAFGAIGVIDDVSLDIASGEFVVFVGQSGCGKSTLLRMIAGLDTVSSGEVLIGGKVVNHLPPARRSIAMVFQSYALYPQMTVRENIGFGLRVAGLASDLIEKRTKAVAETLRLMPLLDRRPRELSGGQRQRVAIGRAIAREPSVFLFDEPLSNLDAALRGDMRIEIARLHAQLGVTSIYVTHDQVEAMTLANRIVVLDAGRIQQVGDPISIYENPANRFVAQFIGTPKMNFFRATPVGDQSLTHAVQLECGAIITLAHPCALPAGNLTLGVRPQHFVPTSEGPDSITCKVVVTERLGSETFAYLETEKAVRLTARFEPDHALRPGDRLHLRPLPEKLHLFASNGEAITQVYDRPLSRKWRSFPT